MDLENGDWPIFGWTADVRMALFSCLDAGRSAVLGTIVALEGGAPQPIGTQMIFDGTKATGYFSGGCIEADVGNHAQRVFADGKPRKLIYGKGSPRIDLRLTCGGSLTIFLERIDPSDDAVKLLLEGYEQRRVVRWSSNGFERSALIQGAREKVEPIEGASYSKIFLPRWRLAVAGDGPIALALIALAGQCGLEAILLRNSYAASPMPIAEGRCISGDASASLKELVPDRWTAIIAASHDDEQDDAVTRMALASNAFYVGVLGSSCRATSRKQRLEALGLSADECARVVSPVGLSNCGRSAWEVAVSVIAQILQVRSSVIAAIA